MGCYVRSGNVIERERNQLLTHQLECTFTAAYLWSKRRKASPDGSRGPLEGWAAGERGENGRDSGLKCSTTPTHPPPTSRAHKNMERQTDPEENLRYYQPDFDCSSSTMLWVNLLRYWYSHPIFLIFRLVRKTSNLTSIFGSPFCLVFMREKRLVNVIKIFMIFMIIMIFMIFMIFMREKRFANVIKMARREARHQLKSHLFHIYIFHLNFFNFDFK